MKNWVWHHKLSLLLLFLGHANRAQVLPYTSKNIGLNSGIQISIGTHVNRIGAFVNFYAVIHNFQANSEIRYYFNFKNLGPTKKYAELVLSQGIVYCFGGAETGFNPFFSVVANQNNFKNSVGYAYQAYFNKIGTKQQTGVLSIQLKEFNLLLQNDLLAKPALDRFRTGAIIVQYNYKNQWLASINAVMWTGQMGHKQSTDAARIPSHCYMDTLGGTYTNFSHGLLFAQFKYNLGLAQIASASAGTDAEQVRNAIQNKVFHDQVFLPKAWRKYKNCHIPMLDSNNKVFLYQEGQKIKSPKPFISASLNESLLY